MNDEDFSMMEAHLDVVLPKAFRNFMQRFPNSSEHQLCHMDFDYLPCNSELFVLKQLKVCADASNNDFDYYELQPELRPRRFLQLGGDGCGNYYFMPGDDATSNELWYWSHDPYDGFLKKRRRNVIGLFPLNYNVAS